MRIRQATVSLLAEQQSRYPFLAMAQAFAGVTAVPEFSRAIDLSQPELEVAVSKVGDVGITFPGVRSGTTRPGAGSTMAGACADEDPATAVVKAVAEAAERYAMSVLDRNEVILSTANELGASALDWRLFPRGLDREYENFPGVVPFDPDKRMRWVQGISLVSGRRLSVPVALTHIVKPSRQSESFTLPISTGVAVHTDVYEATARAIMEVVERDAIALTWYLQRKLPRIHAPIDRPGEYAERFRSFERAQVEQHLFDATTDLGIPVVYGMMLTRGHDAAAVVVTAACDLDPVVATAKCMREAVSTRQAIASMDAIPKTPEECVTLEHGAAYMGRRSRIADFNFLLDVQYSMPADELPNHDAGDSRKNLRWLIRTLSKKGLEAVAVELTTDELRACGLRAVRVVIPQLMPMSYVTNQRFLAHPRLTQYGKLVHGESFTPDTVNPLPQPFA